MIDYLAHKQRSGMVLIVASCGKSANLPLFRDLLGGQFLSKLVRLTFGDDFWRCCAFDTALWQLFCPRGLVFLFFKISILGSIQPKIVNCLESNDLKNMDLKTSFATNPTCIIAKFCLISTRRTA